MPALIAFDADDTLWENEAYYVEAYRRFGEIVADFAPSSDLENRLVTHEIQNIPLYGYGIKSFTLSMIEAAIGLTGVELPERAVLEILEIGKGMLDKPVDLLPGVGDTLEFLTNEKIPLAVITKGDLLDQSRKFEKSGLRKFFHHFEVVNEKDPETYRRLLIDWGVQPNEFFMIGNSPKSDILPPLRIGGYALHVPSKVGWVHDRVEASLLDVSRYRTIPSLTEFRSAFEGLFFPALAT